MRKQKVCGFYFGFYFGDRYHTFNNSLYSAGSAFSNGPCHSFTDWQQAGQDSGSAVLPLPSIDDIVKMGQAVLAPS